MPISPARKSAYEILQRVESGHAFAVDLLQREQAFRLKEADQGLATELVMGVLRWRGELDFEIEQLSARKAKSFDPEVLAILRMGIYQIRFLERVPKHAVVHDAVEMTKAVRKRSAAGLVNAVLRKCEPAGVFARSDDFDRLSAENRASVRRTFPAWLLDRWERITVTTAESGDFGAIRLAYASLRTPRTTLRVVDARLNPEDVRQELESEGVTTVRCLFAEKSGLSVTSGRVHSTRAYQEGRVVIQDEASQLVAELVSPEHGQRVLDVCAAPGMKAGQLAQMLGTGSLVACDHSAPRLSTLSRLLPPQVPATVRWCMVRLDASHELPFTAKFHRILLDAPCSGTGTLARNPEIKWRLHPEDITRLAALQAMMLRNTLPLLANGGRLVYATCSLEPEENEGVVERVLAEFTGFRVVTSHELALEHPRLIPLFDPRGYFRTRPDQHAMDGFNAVVIEREESR